MLDSSGSIGTNNWHKTLQFVWDVSRGLKEGTRKARIAVVTYDCAARSHWMLDGEASHIVLQFVHSDDNSYNDCRDLK